MCLLGCDIGSSSIKVSIVDEETGLTIGADFYPKEEAPIKALSFCSSMKCGSSGTISGS